MLNSLMELYELAYQQLNIKVTYLIDNGIRNKRLIENTFEELLNIPTDKCYDLFIKLCNYVKTFDEQLVIDYQTIYEELYGEETNKTKKRSH